MSDLQILFQRQAESAKAFEQITSAQRAYELAKIRERLAELKSQHEPLETLIKRNVVVGRIPDLPETK